MTTTLMVRRAYGDEPLAPVKAESDGLIAVHPAFEHPSASPDQFRWIVTHVPSGIAFHAVKMQKPMADAFADELRALPHGEDWQFTDLPAPPTFTAQAAPIAKRYKALAIAAQEDAEAKLFSDVVRPAAIANLTIVRDQLDRAIDALQERATFDEELRDYLTDLHDVMDTVDMPCDVVLDRQRAEKGGAA